MDKSFLESRIEERANERFNEEFQKLVTLSTIIRLEAS